MVVNARPDFFVLIVSSLKFQVSPKFVISTEEKSH